MSSEMTSASLPGDSGRSASIGPRLQGLTFCFTGELVKDEYNCIRLQGEPLTEEHVARIIEREGGTLLSEIVPELHYLLRLGRNYPPTLRQEVEDRNYATNSRITQYELDSFLREFLWPSRAECVEMLRSGRVGVERFSELMDYAYGGRRIDLRGIDMRNLDLEGVNLEHAIIDGVDFREANLPGATLPHAARVVLDGANLANAAFKRLTDSSLAGANLAAAARCRFAHCNLNEANLSGAEIEEFTECTCRNANLDGSKWIGLHKWERNDFSGASVRDVRFMRGGFQGSEFRGANLENSIFYEFDMADIDLRDANCRGTSFGYTNLASAQVAGADFTGAVLRGSNLEGVDISSATGLADAQVTPRGTIGRRVLELERICNESQRVFFEGIAETDTHRIEFELLFEQRSSRPPAASPEWRLYDKRAEGAEPMFLHRFGGGEASLYTKFLMDITGYWADAIVQWDTIKVASSKAPLKGRELKEVVVAALREAWGQE